MSGCEAEMVINLLWGAVTITVTGTAALYLTVMFGVAVPVGVIAFIFKSFYFINSVTTLIEVVYKVKVEMKNYILKERGEKRV